MDANYDLFRLHSPRLLRRRRRYVSLRLRRRPRLFHLHSHKLILRMFS